MKYLSRQTYRIDIKQEVRQMMGAHKDRIYRTNREGEYKITMFIVFQRQFLRWMSQRADSVKLESKLLKRNIDMKRYSEFIELIEKF